MQTKYVTYLINDKLIHITQFTNPDCTQYTNPDFPAPHEDYLSVHIRTLKGWTKVLRNLAIKNEKNPERNPNLFVDGPFGEAHQDYSNYEVWFTAGVLQLGGYSQGVTAGGS